MNIFSSIKSCDLESFFNLYSCFQGDAEELLLYSYECGCEDICCALIEMGIYSEKMMMSGDFLIHACCRNDYRKILGKIISSGYNLNLINAEGAMPIHSALYAGKYICASMLIDAGADIYARDRIYGESACEFIEKMKNGIDKIPAWKSTLLRKSGRRLR